jgi:aminomethyltransferase
LQVVKHTPFHSRTHAANQLNLWHRWRDYTVSDAYFDVALEYTALRNACAVFDISPMTTHRISGPDALPFLNRLVTRDVSKIHEGHVGYCVWCDDQGQVIDDGTIFHLGHNDYRLCSQERQLDWLVRSALGFDVQIREETTEIAALALQGPTSAAVLRAMGISRIDSLTPFSMTVVDLAGAPLMISRTGFTGDLGYELWVAPSHAEKLWDALFEAGRFMALNRWGLMPLKWRALRPDSFRQVSIFCRLIVPYERIGPAPPWNSIWLGWLISLKTILRGGQPCSLSGHEDQDIAWYA